MVYLVPTQRYIVFVSLDNVSQYSMLCSVDIAVFSSGIQMNCFVIGPLLEHLDRHLELFSLTSLI